MSTLFTPTPAGVSCAVAMVDNQSPHGVGPSVSGSLSRQDEVESMVPVRQLPLNSCYYSFSALSQQFCDADQIGR